MGITAADVLTLVGRRLRELRRGRGMTLAGVARRTGVNESTLSRLEGGLRKPTLELLLSRW
ncbi:helix-turn-helix domain-containing protein [Sphaerisporangium sp. NPDC004334]